MKKLLFGIIVAVITVTAVACQSDADIASRNTSKAADQFEVQRRIVFYNGITDSYMLTIEGMCSLGNFDRAGELTVTCLIARDGEGHAIVKKHFLGLSDNVTYFVEQTEPVGVSTSQYRVIFRPSAIVPDIELDK